MMKSKNLFSVLSLAILFLVSGVQRGSCQQVESKQESATESTPLVNEQASAVGVSDAVTTPVSGESKFRGRLPRFFSAVVRPEQRQEIYRIQLSYRARIEELERALMELRTAQAQEVERVLSASQLEQVVAMRDQAMRELRMRSADGVPKVSDPTSMDGDK